jgi:hypothetical protein
MQAKKEEEEEEILVGNGGRGVRLHGSLSLHVWMYLSIYANECRDGRR